MKALKEQGLREPLPAAVRRRAHQPDPLPARRQGRVRRDDRQDARGREEVQGRQRQARAGRPRRRRGGGIGGAMRRSMSGDRRSRSLALAARRGEAQPAAKPPDLATAKVVDLTHAFDEKTIYWPTSPSAFELKQQSLRTDAGRLVLLLELVLHARARRHAPRRADPLLEGRPDGGPDPRAAAHRPRRGDRRPDEGGAPIPTTG